MSLPEARKAGSRGLQAVSSVMPRRSFLRALIVGSAAATLTAACGSGGFRPLYGSAQFGGAAAHEKMAQVEFAPIPGRAGQHIRNELIFQATGGGTPPPPVYRLEIAVAESVSSTLVKSDGNALSNIYNIDASYKLVRLSDRKVVLSGKSFGRASFERHQSIFANVRASDDAENRAAKTVGDELKARISAYLATET